MKAQQTTRKDETFDLGNMDKSALPPTIGAAAKEPKAKQAEKRILGVYHISAIYKSVTDKVSVVADFGAYTRVVKAFIE